MKELFYFFEKSACWQYYMDNINHNRFCILFQLKSLFITAINISLPICRLFLDYLDNYIIRMYEIFNYWSINRYKLHIHYFKLFLKSYVQNMKRFFLAKPVLSLDKDAFAWRRL